MSEQLLTVLKLCLLVLLYLFFFRVLRSVWLEINGPPVIERRPGPAKPERAPKGKKVLVTTLTVVEPVGQRGRTYPLSDELTVGRAAGCQVVIDDTYASQIHARVFARDGQLMVEDLGSTNGTLLNKKKVTGPTVMRRGDRLQVGTTVMELT